MHIIFNKITIKNFLSIGEASFNFTEKGITLIEGRNLQDLCSNSNGSGKSSIFEAILWNLTGSTSRGTNEVSNKVTGFPAEVSLSFKFDNIDYQVIRKSNPSTLSIFQNGKDISGSTFLKSKKILTEVLGFIDYELLSSIIILSQGLGSRLSILKPSERKSRIEFFSNLQSLISKATDKAAEVYSIVEKQHQSILAEKNKLLGFIEHNNSLIAGYQRKIDESKANSNKILASDEYEALKANKLDLEKQKEAKEKERSDINKKNYEIQLQQNRLIIEIKSNNNQLIQLKEDYKKILQKICPTCNQPLLNANERAGYYESEIKDKFEKVSELKIKLSELDMIQDASALDSEIEQIRKNIEAISRKIADHEKYSSETSAFECFIAERETENSETKTKLLPLERQLTFREKDVQIAKWIKASITKKFRNFLLDGVIDYLNKRVAVYSEYLFKERRVYIENKENNLYICLDDYAFENLSGGEGRRVDLILQLALRDLAINQTGFYCNLLVLDEVFDYLDKTGIDNFLLMIDSEFAMAESVIIVTHRDNLDIPITSKYTVTKNEIGISSISHE